MSLKNQLNKVNDKVINSIGKASMKVGNRAFGVCMVFAIYEPKIPDALIKENYKRK
ncbi:MULTISPECIES: AgrD family cyclic lactone autoinducer peptide [Clostridium]|uniref:AgrD family cyclic lactone autoinducer peptide n=1 Tax=Clostridium TaxID=1485 RepID=UPI0009BEFD5A|nr:MULTISPECIES: cyclic lactone autoinducer peptide [Clostridium]PJI08303.1 cyclic lactone autoinducer peptide [Clostridium sp. CT7]